MRRTSRTRVVLIVVAASLLVVAWNIRVFSFYAMATIPLSFALVVFTMMAIGVVRSVCGNRHARSRSA